MDNSGQQTQRTPMPTVDRRAANYLYAIIDQVGNALEISEYNFLVQQAHDIRQANLTLTLEDVANQFSTSPVGTWWLRLPEFENLTDSDLIIFLETHGHIRFSSLLQHYSTEITALALLEHESTSEALRLSLAISFYAAPRISIWLCGYEHGRMIPKIVPFFIQANELDEESEASAEYARIVRVIVSARLAHWQGMEENEAGLTFLDSLSPEVVTPDFLSAISTIRPFGHSRSVELYVRGLSAHARRLYDFDEALPDEWIVKAIS